ncbi:MAG: DUF305 domain-containing protein [Pseudohongiellaceae bacterium]
MTATSRSANRFARRLLVTALLGGVAANAVAQAPIVQPGAPGQPSRQINAEEAADLASIRYSEADVRFMQDMIAHHRQAVDMAALVEGRTNRDSLHDLARRVALSQEDEIAFMEGWLSDRDRSVPDDMAHHNVEEDERMAGMASPEEMAALEEAEGAAFDSLFLELMIDHHEGALTMVEELLDQPGSAHDPVLFEFTSEVTTDQGNEIERMTAMLAGFSPDPRVNLAAGFLDAGQALLNMELLTSLPKPDGFFDPNNPGGLPMSRLNEEDEEDGQQEEEAEEEQDEDSEPRPALLNFANTDIAFAGNVAIAGNYHGFNLYDISTGDAPQLMSSVVCPGGQGDVSVVGDLLIMSVEQTRGRLDCGLQGVAEPVSDERFRGLRIFDISDMNMPRQVGAVQTCRGSHTHTVVAGPGEDGRLIVYNSGTSVVRDEEEMAECSDESPYRDEDTALFRIDVIEIPVDRPEESRIINRPFVFSDPESGVLAGLWEGGDHGPDTQSSNETNHCHDITAFPELQIAAGACSGNGILFDISDPENPTRLDQVIDSGFAYWHSATFNNDGSKVIFTDEWGGGSRPRCRASDPDTWGADAIYDIVDNRLEFRSYYKMPAPQSEQENCVAHNGSLVPVPGRDIFAQSWYQGGISVVDFTDSANPVEIAFFDRGPIDEEELVMGGYWSAYWHEGLIYGTEIARGLDVLALTPSDYLTGNEIAAASFDVDETVFNPQQQMRYEWPDEPVVARAYMDQLQRANALSAARAAALEEALDRATARLDEGAEDPATATELESLSAGLLRDSDGQDDRVARRMTALGETLSGIAIRLR